MGKRYSNIHAFFEFTLWAVQEIACYLDLDNNNRVLTYFAILFMQHGG
jgi:hypothetical protein